MQHSYKNGQSRTPVPTFYALSKELGIAPTVFSDWKAGRSIPKTDKLLKIGNYFNVSITEFIE